MEEDQYNFGKTTEKSAKDDLNTLVISRRLQLQDPMLQQRSLKRIWRKRYMFATMENHIVCSKSVMSLPENWFFIRESAHARQRKERRGQWRHVSQSISDNFSTFSFRPFIYLILLKCTTTLGKLVTLALEIPCSHFAFRLMYRYRAVLKSSQSPSRGSRSPRISKISWRLRSTLSCTDR